MNAVAARLERVAVRPEDFPKDGRPEVVLMGRSNVGKSSLINRLMGQAGLARVSKAPGRTRELHFYSAADDKMYVVDVPGLGYARVSKGIKRGWAELLDAYLDGRDPLALVMHLVDSRHEPQPIDHEVSAMLRDRELPAAVVLTKSDKIGRGAVARAVALAQRELALPPDFPIIATSAETGAGLAELHRLVQHSIAALKRR